MEPGRIDASRTQPGTSRHPAAAQALALGLLLAVTALAYAPALSGPFVLDDDPGVLRHAGLRRPDALRPPALHEFLGAGRPVTAVTFALDWRAAGADPRRFHATGIALHLAAVLAAWAFLRSLLRRTGHPRAAPLALVGAAVFALHPIQAESVAYVSQRSEVLAGLLSLVALLLLDAAAAGGRTVRGALAWAGGVGAWVVAMGAKTVAIAVPGALVLEQAVAGAAGDARGIRAVVRRALRALLLAAPMLALAAWSASLQFRSFEAEPGGGAGFTATALSPVQYLLTQLRVQWLYLRLLAWPAGLAFDRDFTPSTGVDGPVLLAAAGVVALVALAAWLWIGAERAGGPAPARRLGALGILWWFVLLSPTSSVVPLVDLAAEHRVYLAMLGPALAATVGVDALVHSRLTGRSARFVGAVAAVLLVVALAVTLRARAQTWGDAEALWRDAAAASPGSARVLTNLGLALSEKGDRAGAEEAYRRAWAVARKPETHAFLARNHASLLLATGRPAEALALLDRAIAAWPGSGDLLLNRAIALDRLGRHAEALTDARAAVTASPDDPRARLALGIELTRAGDLGGAVAEFRAAEALDPGNPAFPVSAGIALAGLGHRDLACESFRRARATTRSLPLPRDAAGRAAALGCPLPP